MLNLALRYTQTHIHLQKQIYKCISSLEPANITKNKEINWDMRWKGTKKEHKNVEENKNGAKTCWINMEMTIKETNKKKREKKIEE